MANKTIYIRDSDLPLWESAQTELGESISALFAEFLRERLEMVDAFVHVLHSSPTDSLKSIRDREFTVMFAPVGPTGTGGAMKPYYVRGSSQLLELLQKWGMTREAVTKIESDLKTEHSVSVRAILLRSAVHAK